METKSIKSSVVKNYMRFNKNRSINNNVTKTYHVSANEKTKNNVSFGRISCKLIFRNIAGMMSNIDETKNAFITMIGTGLIAPFAIMCSPKKPCRNPKPSDDVKDREKKLFQALRQPISAALAFAFNMVSIYGINKLLNYGAYKAHWGMFKDEGLKELIPDGKYLEKEARTVLKGKADNKLAAEWAEELNFVQKNDEQLKSGLKEKIRAEYDDVGITLDKAALEEKASSKSAMQDFKIEKMVEAKQKKLKEAKVQELMSDVPKNLDTELITEDYQKQVRKLCSDEFDAIEKRANLKWYDKFLRIFGYNTKKVTALENEKTELMNKKGIELVKTKMGKAFDNVSTKLKAYVDIRTPKAQKVFKNKLFWISLATNLVTLALSCVALNWLHPKLAAGIDKLRGKNAEQTPSTEKKVEVSTCR